jgi:undecaprenyl-phosphate 4-deoxy-4-formamido-L-arabinose transferase
LLGVLVSLGAVATYVVVLSKHLLTAGSAREALMALWDRDVLEFFLIGITLFGIGLVGEYVGRIHEQVRGRPRYLVQAVLEVRGAPPATASSTYREPARLHPEQPIHEG